jgi:uncharacterized protein YceH (UPF0502 family)
MVNVTELHRLIDELPSDYQQHVYEVVQSLNSYWQRRQEYLKLSPEARVEAFNAALDQFQEAELMPPIEEDVETRIAKLNEAFAELREGLTQEELDDIVWAMNYKYVHPDLDKEYDWLNEQAETDNP